jgi:UDP:flavonoid glycosyltransferase YjiC (YdhE family)
MRIVIVAVGTWGDVRPIVILGQALQKSGYDVLLIATEEFRVWVQARGINFVALSVNLQALADIDMTNPLKAIQTLRRFVAPTLVQMGKDIAAVLREGDTLMLSEWVLGVLNGIVEKHRTRLILINLQPLLPTSEFPPSFMPPLPAWMSASNRAMGYLFQWFTWLIYGSVGNQLRTTYLSIPKQTWTGHRAMLNSTPSLLLASRHVVPVPADWKSHQRVTGYLFDEDDAWQAPQDLLNFLDAGEKPVYIGFGSMSAIDKHPEMTTRLILEAVSRSGRRAILPNDWEGIGALDLHKDIFLLKYAPHTWLFPRMAAVVHHGGAGTTASGLKAGVASVIVPVIIDQPFWAQRVYELGVGTKPIPRRKLTAEKLAAAITEATTNRAIQDNVTELSRKIAAEDGIDEAVKTMHEFLA